MPEMIPIGNTIVPPNPQQGLNTLSSIIGIKQQQQTLQTGQALQQTAQAGAQQQQEQMVERQKLQAFMQGGKDTDGSQLDPNSDDFGTKVANFARGNLPLIGNDVAQAALKTQNDKISLRGSVADLQQKYRTGLGGIVSGFVGSGANSDQVNNAIDEYIRQNPDAMEAGHWAESLIDHVDKTKDPNIKDHMLATLSSTLSGTPQQEAGSVDVGGQIKPGAVSKFGLGFTPQGPAIKKSIAPTGPEVPGQQPSSQDWENFGGYNANLNSRVQQATDSMPRIELAEQALQGMRAGGGADFRINMARRLQAVGMDSLANAVSGGSLADAQVAEKMLFQTTMSGLRQSMQGDPARVAEFQAADKVFPNVGTDPKASQEILEFMRGQAQRDYAEQQALNTSRKAGTFNPATWQADYQQQLRAGKVPGVPSSQVPGSVKTMPGGDRLTSYAKAHFGGDTKKASAYLQSQGYQ